MRRVAFAVRLAGIICVVSLALITRESALGDQGVGITVGVIQVDEALSRGGSYSLPDLGVLNTGDEAGSYEVSVSYSSSQTQKAPPTGWFDLQPRTFFLAPGTSQSVQVRLTVPTGASPGDYFAYLEARPLGAGPNAAVSVSAATKLSFTVKPSSWLAAQRLRFNRFLDDNQPWSWLLPALALLALAFWALRKLLPYRLRSPFERK
jgi:hypothetical protein